MYNRVHVGGHEGLANQNAGRINNPQILQQSQLFNISESLQAYTYIYES